MVLSAHRAAARDPMLTERLRARAARVRAGRPVRAVPRARLPDGIELAFYRDLEARVVEPLREVVRRYVLPRLREVTAGTDSAVNSQTYGDSALVVRGDAAASDLLVEVMRAARIAYATRVTDQTVDGIVARHLADTSDFNAAELDRQFGAVLGVRPLRREPWLGARLKDAAHDAAGLIRSLPEDAFTRIERASLRAVLAGRRSEEIARMVERDFLARTGTRPDGSKMIRGVSYQARRIARDQVSKLNGALTSLRQRELGVERYVWRTSLDERVRPEHREREGRVYSWDDPPDDGHPGEAVQCRCTAEPVLDDIAEAA